MGSERWNEMQTLKYLSTSPRTWDGDNESMQAISDKIDDLKEILSKFGLTALFETWQNGFDPAIWERSNPSGGLAQPWQVNQLDAYANLDASDSGYINTKQLYRTQYSEFNTQGIIKKIVFELTLYLDNPGNMHTTNAFIGLANNKNDDGSSNNIIGFRFRGTPGLQSVTDSGGTETTNNITVSSWANKIKIKFEISSSGIEFFLNEVSQFTHTTNISEGQKYPVFYFETTAGGTCEVRIGEVNIYPEVV